MDENNTQTPSVFAVGESTSLGEGGKTHPPLRAPSLSGKAKEAPSLRADSPTVWGKCPKDKGGRARCAGKTVRV